MFLQLVFLWVLGISSGIMVSAGVFTVLFVVGLVPRFAGRTNTAKYEIFYEECLIAGSVLGTLLSVFPINGHIGASKLMNTALLVLTGIFAGIFVGCLSIALAEVLDGLPVFARRIKLKIGVSTAVAAIAFGKLAGSLFYFLKDFYIGI